LRIWEELLRVNPKKVILYVLIPLFLLLSLYIHESSEESLLWSFLVAFVGIWSIGLGVFVILIVLGILIEFYQAISDSLKKSIIWILKRLQ